MILLPDLSNDSRNLSIRQAALEFNMNYRVLSDYYKKF